MRYLLCLALIAGAGCGDDDSGTEEDAGPRIDIGFPGDDTGPGPDTGPPPDGGEPDGSMDLCGDLGEACTPDRGCRRSAFCQAEITFDLASDEMVRDLPAGTDTTGTFFAGGYCTPDDFSGDSLNFCDPADPADTTCGECGSCVNLGPDTMCARDCVATAADNADCRDDGYSCDLTLEVCFPGCNSDAECRIGRQETNGIDELQTPDDCMEDPSVCGGDATNFDELVYSTTGNPTCNTDTFRCEFTGTAGAEAGDACTIDSDCEDNGDCINFTNDDGTPAWPGNYCTKFRCDLAGIDCAGDGKCQERGVGLSICLAGCTVGSGAGVDPDDNSTWLVAPDGCRDGYACNWDGMGGAGVADNGGCVPGEFNAVTTPNVGGTCDSDADCWSPFGLGFCIEEGDSFTGGYCTIRDCGAPGLPAGINGPNGICVPGFDGEDPTFALSLQQCASPADCRDDYACIDLDGMGTTACFPSCQVDEECKATQMCDIPAGAMVGECVDR